MTSFIDVDLGKDGGLGGVHHRTLRTPEWLNYQTSNCSETERCQHGRFRKGVPSDQHLQISFCRTLVR